MAIIIIWHNFLGTRKTKLILYFILDDKNIHNIRIRDIHNIELGIRIRY